ncbi:hypothetical protein ACWNT8_12080 [Pigmentibacter ruber]|uniref:hypothetical protein n=1 Tax=Pigmentibacter ruber TaxID=2683196 RepID=UPI00131CA5A4|nr:hypothetical protein [Pigmentibacter ruber]
MNSNRFFIMILTLFCSVMTTACLTVGNQFPSTVVWIKANETTRTEIEKAYGPPFRVGYDSGMKTYSYGYYKYSAFSESQTKDLTIRFNSNDTVYNYTFSSSFPEDKK